MPDCEAYECGHQTSPSRKNEAHIDLTKNEHTTQPMDGAPTPTHALSWPIAASSGPGFQPRTPTPCDLLDECIATHTASANLLDERKASQRTYSSSVPAIGRRAPPLDDAMADTDCGRRTYTHHRDRQGPDSAHGHAPDGPYTTAGLTPQARRAGHA